MRSDLETFSLKQRVFLVKNYYQYTGDYLCVKTKYEDNYKDSNEFPPFSYDILIEIINLFERTGSVLKATEGASGGTGQIIEQIYVRDFVKEEDPMALSRGVPIPSTSSAQSTKGDHLDDQEDSMMWDQSGFASDDDDSDNTPLARKHACDQCGVSFSSLEEWNGHQMKKHNIIPDISQSSKSASHKKLRTLSPKKKLPMKGRKKLPYCEDLFIKKMEETKNEDTESEEVPTLATNLDFLQAPVVYENPPAVGTVKLDPSYDKILKEITKKLDRILKVQKITSTEKIVIPIDEALDVDFGFPLSTKEQLTEFNNKLKNDEYRLSCIKELCKVTGYSGTSNGTKCSYILTDRIFDRKLLTLYSWSGVSHSGTKESFCNYTHFLEMFHSVVRMADNSFSKVDVDGFFRNKALKHSASRSEHSKRIPLR